MLIKAPETPAVTRRCANSRASKPPQPSDGAHCRVVRPVREEGDLQSCADDHLDLTANHDGRYARVEVDRIDLRRSSTSRRRSRAPLDVADEHNGIIKHGGVDRFESPNVNVRSKCFEPTCFGARCRTSSFGLLRCGHTRRDHKNKNQHNRDSPSTILRDHETTVFDRRRELNLWA